MRSSDGKLRRHCVKLLRKVNSTPDAYNIYDLAKKVALWRQREIYLLPFSMPVEIPCGLWISSENHDYVYFEERTSSLHQQHIIAHELGHLVFEHDNTHDPEFGMLAARDLMPNLDPELIRRALRRAHYNAPAEREAEMFATVAIQWSGKNRTPPAADSATERFRNAVEGEF